MSKFDDAVEKAKNQLEDLGTSVDHDLLKAVAKGLGPALYNKDAALVSVTSNTEMETLRRNFVMNKLGISSEEEAKKACEDVAEKMDGINRKHRLSFYYLLVDHLGKESVYQ